jgi:hypothetical protein
LRYTVIHVAISDEAWQRLNTAAIERDGPHPGTAERDRRIAALAEAAVEEAALGWWLERGRPELAKETAP